LLISKPLGMKYQWAKKNNNKLQFIKNVCIWLVMIIWLKTLLCL